MSHVPCTESDMVWLVDDDKPQQNHHNSGYRCRWRSHGLLFVSSLRRDMDPSLGFVCRVHRDMDSTYSPLCGVHSIYRISSSRFVAYTRFVRLSFQCLLYLQSSSGSGLLGRSGGSSFPVCIVAMVLCSWIRATTFRTGLSSSLLPLPTIRIRQPMPSDADCTFDRMICLQEHKSTFHVAERIYAATTDRTVATRLIN
jgi:hypothetical protein